MTAANRKLALGYRRLRSQLAPEDPPDGLAELRDVLMNEFEWRQREGLG
jgi:hypothetical protein